MPPAEAPAPVDVSASGAGAPVGLVHSSASGNGQWAALARALAPTRRVIAPNLFGYGATPPWPGPARQRLADPAGLVLRALAGTEGPVDLVGHSFGASVALEAARALGPRAGRLVLYEPNLFALLNRPETRADYAEIETLYAEVTACAARGDPRALAAAFAGFFSGPDAWAAMPEPRKAALAAALAPNPPEWDAVMDQGLRPDRWDGLGGPVLLCWAEDSPAPLQTLARLLRDWHPGWQIRVFARGGHMVPLTRARAFNDTVLSFLSGGDPEDRDQITR